MIFKVVFGRNHYDLGLAKSDLHVTGSNQMDDLSTTFEEEYRLVSIQDQKNAVLFCMMSFVLLFDSFVVNDWIMFSDTISIWLIGKFVFVTPICVSCCFVIRHSTRFYQQALWCFCVTMSVTLTVMLSMSAGDARASYVVGLLLIMVGTTALTRPRMTWAASSIALQCACVVFVIFKTDIVRPADRSALSLMCISGAVISALTVFTFETTARRSFSLQKRVTMLNETLRTMSKTDPLTGLGNRRALEDATLLYWSRKQDVPQHASVILIDVDHFKLFNDTFGHLAGDKCLQAVSRLVMEEMLASADIAIRYGGEEILAFLSNSSLSHASFRAEMLRSKVEAAAIPHISTERRIVTVSIGVASCCTSMHSPETLIGMADSALYKAKASGRNQVQVANIEAVAIPSDLGKKAA